MARTVSPDARQKRWRQYLADERAEAAVYHELAQRKSGQERDILLGLAEAEARHQAYWLKLLGDDEGKPLRGDLRTRSLAFLARHFGSLFVLILAQRAMQQLARVRPVRFWSRVTAPVSSRCGPRLIHG